MRISVEKEHDNCRQTMELDEQIADVEVDMGLFRFYANAGENPSHFASVELTKNEIELLLQKYAELKDQVIAHEEPGNE